MGVKERKRYRRADKFSELVVKFTAETLDKLYSDVRENIEDVDISPSSNAIRTARRLQGMKTVVLTDFAMRLFHARTLVLYRVGCFPDINLNTLDALFEQMEDDFTLAVANLTAFDNHPESVTVEIAKASSQIMRIVLEREAELSADKKHNLRAAHV